VLSNWTGLLVASLISFFLSPFIVSRLGDSGYGVWTLMASLTGYLGLLDLGVRGAVTRYVAQLNAQSDHKEAGRIVSSALAIFGVVGLVIIVLVIVSASPIVSVFHIPEAYEAEAQAVLIVSGLGMALSLISGVFGGIVAGVQRFDWQNGIEITVAIFRALAIIIVLTRGYGLLGLAWVHLLFIVLSGLAYLAASSHLYRDLKVSLRGCAASKIRLILSFGTFILLLDLARQMILYTGSVVIGSFLPVAAVTLFVIASNLVIYARSLILGISTILLPRASATEAAGQQSELRRLLLRSARWATLIILPIVVTFYFRGETFIGLWMGPSYAQSSGGVLRILSLALGFMGSTHVGTAVMLGIGRHRALAPAVLIEAACNLALSICLVRQWGINGVAWGTTIPSLVVSLVFWPLYARRVLRIALVDFIRSAWLRPALAIVPFGLLTVAVARSWEATNLFFFFLQVATLLPLAALGAWFWGLDVTERRHLSDRLIRPLFSPRHRT
jgi:O-antigen/teichoic acid export membrane protein